MPGPVLNKIGPQISNEDNLTLSQVLPAGLPGQNYFIERGSNVFPDYILSRGIITETPEEFQIASTAGISLEEVFKKWQLFSHFYKEGYPDLNSPPNFPGLDPTGLSGDPLTSEDYYNQNIWGYDSQTDSILLKGNYGAFSGFISPKPYLNYTLSASLSSTDTDDDWMSLVMAFYVDPLTGFEHTLSVNRVLNSRSGQSEITYAIVYNFAQTTEQIIVDGTNLAPLVSGQGTGWVGNNSKLEVIRESNLFTVKTSQFGKDDIDDATTLTVDLEQYDILSIFRNPCQVGFAARSQKNAFFSNVQFTGITDYIVHITEDQNEVWQYDSIANKYVITSLAYQDVLGINKFIYSYFFEKTYYTGNKELIKISNKSILNLPSNSTSKDFQFLKSKSDVPLILFTGQSNSDERALNSELDPSDLRDYPNLLVYDISIQGFTIYNPTKFNDSNKHNILLHFAKELESINPDQIFYVVNYGVGGTPISDHLAGGAVYEVFYNNYYLPALEYLLSEGKTPCIFMFFAQGERDSNTDAEAVAFEDKQLQWVNEWQTRTSRRLPICNFQIIESDANDILINNSFKNRFRDQINCDYIYTQDASSDDGLHYNAAGLALLAPRMISFIKHRDLYHYEKSSVFNNNVEEPEAPLSNELTKQEIYDFSTYAAPTTDSTRFEDNVGAHEILSINGKNRLKITGTTVTGEEIKEASQGVFIQNIRFAEVGSKVRDAEITYTYNTSNIEARAGFYLRGTKSDTYYDGYVFLHYSNNQIRLYKLDNGGLIYIISSEYFENIEPNTDAFFKISIIGRDLQIKKSPDGIQPYEVIGSFTDSDPGLVSSGKIGIAGDFAGLGQETTFSDITIDYNTI